MKMNKHHKPQNGANKTPTNRNKKKPVTIKQYGSKRGGIRL